MQVSPISNNRELKSLEYHQYVKPDKPGDWGVAALASLPPKMSKI